MTLADFAILAALQAVAIFILRIWTQSAIQHEWNKRFEQFKYELRIKERASAIAELLAEWDSRPDNPKRLNQLVLEANLWLPETAARELNRILTQHPAAKFPKELVVEIRHLLRGEPDALMPDEIPYFPKRNEPAQFEK